MKFLWICLVLAFFFALNTWGLSLEYRTCGAPADAVPLYRLFNSRSGSVDHWYTPDAAAVTDAVPKGYAFENVLGLVFLTQEEGTAPLYHVVSASATDNLYTMNLTEVGLDEANGYASVPNPPTLYIYATQVCGSVPVYRLYSAAGTDSFYTTSEAERLQFIANDGYTDLGIMGYVLPLGCS
ncbi:hypothetical protein FB45DRAFT_841768 [Roridomyces roridus]|uniref:DUF5648 domain-containing protein n=1 Tax=Roridomyces roridus TaxID=1738132 RepID=A0AAD7BBT3_9AGAR|nr:hypothetical protein FB45DRAFT_841768 [Roridomyces roridus]